MIFTFWEGPQPDYIKLCLSTWTQPYTLLTYDNLHEYTDLTIDDRLKRFTLPQIVDVVRVHVLRDQGGYWLDADTIMVTGELPKEMILGNDEERTNTIGYLHTEPHSEMYERWARYQDLVYTAKWAPVHWSVMGNDFTDGYLRAFDNIRIGDIRTRWPETYMIHGNASRSAKYHQFYFASGYHLSDIEPTDLIMLHNSWTPGWYKQMSEAEILKDGRTLSNILREVRG